MMMKCRCWVTMLVMLMFAMAMQSQAQLTEARDTPQRDGAAVGIGVASNTTIYAGAMVAINAAGYAVAASDATGIKVVGRAEETVANTGTNGAETIDVRRGVFRWVNGDTFTRADVGNLAYVEDDATVQKAASATYDIVAGLIIEVDSDGVWVDTYAIGSQGAASLTTLDASGNATVGGTLDVTGATTVGGTLAVTGVATFTVAPVLTATTAAGAETVTMTNAPGAGDPVWVDVAIGTNTYVVPLFPAE